MSTSTGLPPYRRPLVPAPLAGHTPPGRVPIQQRSRDRLERILNEAAALIVEAGSDALRMSDVAERSEISIGSLYQYFPDKTALLATLADRYNAVGRECVAAALATVQIPADLPGALIRLMEEFYGQYLSEPVMLDVWSSTQVDRELLKQDRAETQALSEMLEAVLTRIYPDVSPADLATSAALAMELIGATVRLAITVERADGERLLETFARSLRGGLVEQFIHAE